MCHYNCAVYGNGLNVSIVVDDFGMNERLLIAVEYLTHGLLGNLSRVVEIGIFLYRRLWPCVVKTHPSSKYILFVV